jgi:hypothetical protein
MRWGNEGVNDKIGEVKKGNLHRDLRVNSIPPGGRIAEQPTVSRPDGKLFSLSDHAAFTRPGVVPCRGSLMAQEI